MTNTLYNLYHVSLWRLSFIYLINPEFFYSDQMSRLMHILCYTTLNEQQFIDIFLLVLQKGNFRVSETLFVSTLYLNGQESFTFKVIIMTIRFLTKEESVRIDTSQVEVLVQKSLWKYPGRPKMPMIQTLPGSNFQRVHALVQKRLRKDPSRPKCDMI